MPSPHRRRVPIGLVLFVLFTGFTLLELWLLYLLAQWTSWGVTILVAIATGLVGSAMAKRQGIAVFQRVRGELMGGRMPVEPLAEGLVLLLGGALLITPGLITDLIGFSTLVHAVRRALARALMAWGRRTFRVTTFGGASPFGAPGPPPGWAGRVRDAEPGTYRSSGSSASRDPNVIDVEFERRDP